MPVGNIPRTRRPYTLCFRFRFFGPSSERTRVYDGLSVARPAAYSSPCRIRIGYIRVDSGSQGRICGASRNSTNGGNAASSSPATNYSAAKKTPGAASAQTHTRIITLRHAPMQTLPVHLARPLRAGIQAGRGLSTRCQEPRRVGQDGLLHLHAVPREPQGGTRSGDCGARVRGYTVLHKS